VIAQSFMKIDLAPGPEARNRFTGLGVQGVQRGAGRVKDTLVLSIFPIDESAAGIEFLIFFDRGELP